MNTHKKQLNRGLDVFSSPIYASKERMRFIKSVLKKFNYSFSATFFRGVVSLLEQEKDIHANISMNCYEEAYITPTTKSIRMKKPKWGKYEKVFVYDVFVRDGDKYTVVYKKDNNPSNYAFESKTFNRKRVDEDLSALFVSVLERNIPQ